MTDLDMKRRIDQLEKEVMTLRKTIDRIPLRDTISGGGKGGGAPSWFAVAQLRDDYFECFEWNPVTKEVIPSLTTVKVAKPWEIQRTPHDGVEHKPLDRDDPFKVSYPYTCDYKWFDGEDEYGLTTYMRNLEMTITEEGEDPVTIQELQRVTPSYVEDHVILAFKMLTGVTDTQGKPVQWQAIGMLIYAKQGYGII